MFSHIKVDIRIRSDIKITNNQPDIYIYNKQKQEIILIALNEFFVLKALKARSFLQCSCIPSK